MDPHPLRISPELLSQVRAGDSEANRRFVEQLYPLVRSHIRSHLRRLADHEDVSQEIFLKIFLKLDQYQGPQPIEHWVSRIAVRSCYDWLRKLRARPSVSYSDLSEAEVELLDKTHQQTSNSDPTAQRELLNGLLDRLIATLKPREQIVIRYLDLEEKSVHEICELTDWSASKVKVTAMRARRKLADNLKRLERQVDP